MNSATLTINYLRVQSANMIDKANSGHPGVCLGAAPVFYSLYKNMKVDAKDPKYFNRDRLCVSAGHASALLYATLNLFNYDIDMSDLKMFKRKDSITTGHPSIKTVGIDTSTGPLGQGIANAVGMAIAEAFLSKKFNRDNYRIFDHYTYAFCGDGDLMEGVGLEAISLAGNLKLNKLIVLYDSNEVTLEANLNVSNCENVKKKFMAQNWNVITVEKNTHKAISSAIIKAQKSINKPTIIIVKSIIGYGSPNAGSHVVHGKPLGAEGIKYLKEKLNYTYPDFVVPESVKSHIEKFVNISKHKIDDEKLVLDSYSRAYPEEYKELQEWLQNKPIRNNPLDLDYNREISSRQALNEIMAQVRVANLIGGTADVAPSTLAYVKGNRDFCPDDHSGSYIHYGVREHAMGAIQNGIILHGGLRSYSSTFLSFSNYMYPTIRMSTLMDIPSIYIFSHDSIAVGVDGSTHQPVEQIGQLRLYPNLNVIRPGNIMETLASYYTALNSQNPTAIITSRQNLQPYKCTLQDALKGGYVLEDGEDITIIATGSEVNIALQVKDKLKSKKINAKVVSMPCIEIFEKQPKSYKDKVLNGKIYVIEASNDTIWYRYNIVKHYGVNDYGFTGEQKELYEHFNITVDKIVKDIVNTIK